jgi:hypothetical protein
MVEPHQAPSIKPDHPQQLGPVADDRECVRGFCASSAHRATVVHDVLEDVVAHDRVEGGVGVADVPIISDADLQGAIDSLDTIIAGLRCAQKAGIACSVEDLTLITLADPDDAASRARTALILSVALMRLAEQ